MYNNLFNKTHLNQETIDELIPILNEFDDCIWIKNIRGEYLAVNDSLCTLLGEDKKTLLHSTGLDIFDYSSFKFVIKDDINVINRKKKSIMNEYLYVKSREVILQTHKIPIINSDDSCSSFLAIAQVINTDELYYNNFIIDNNYKTLCNLITESEEKREQVSYEEIYEYLMDIYESMDINGTSLWLYDDFKKILIKKMCLGIPETVSDKTTFAISDFYKDELINISTKMNSPTPLKNCEDFFCNTGFCQSYKYFLKDNYIIVLPIVYNNSRLLGILNLYYNDSFDTESNAKYMLRTSKRLALLLKNIHLSNQLTYQLQKKIKLENELSRFLNIAVDLYTIIDTKGYIKKISSNIPFLLGWSFNDLKNIPIQNLIVSTENSINFKEPLHTYNKKFYGGICKVKCKNNSLKLIEWYYYHQQETDEIFITGKDVTSFSKLEEKVASLEEKIECEKFKTEFLANISHEFKTPLNIILASIQLELNHCDSIDDNNSIYYNRLNMIKQNSYRLLRLVDNLIDITQVDSNHIKLYKENINAICYFEDIVDSVSYSIKKMNKNIIFDTNEEEVFLAYDPEKIEKVILNLISNSIKYTEINGNIWVTLTTNWDENRLYISVKDDGVGIPTDSYDIIFERFKQADNLFIRRAEGSGIGLPLAKSFIELHGGEIWVNKNLDKGSEFIFYLPIISVKDAKVNYFYNKVVDSRSEKLKIEFSDIYSYSN
ncbi:HAMP domain-containing sensor histidine kinase [uncultured Clostridium sp.]|uniref:PAS domain-containing sensor histidine kinase n=1 Tax=uncultured Clostridium sp. TaxID=59620 RepID=UPI0032162434